MTFLRLLEILVLATCLHLTNSATLEHTNGAWFFVQHGTIFTGASAQTIHFSIDLEKLGTEINTFCHAVTDAAKKYPGNGHISGSFGLKHIHEIGCPNLMRIFSSNVDLVRDSRLQDKLIS